MIFKILIYLNILITVGLQIQIQQGRTQHRDRGSSCPPSKTKKYHKDWELYYFYLFFSVKYVLPLLNFGLIICYVWPCTNTRISIGKFFSSVSTCSDTILHNSVSLYLMCSVIIFQPAHNIKHSKVINKCLQYGIKMYTNSMVIFLILFVNVTNECAIFNIGPK